MPLDFDARCDFRFDYRSGHRVECRDGPRHFWKLRNGPNPEHYVFQLDGISGSKAMTVDGWILRERPSWLPIAWLCCEADPIDGPPRASAILDAASGDNEPALLACNWMGSINVQGTLDLGEHRSKTSAAYHPMLSSPGTDCSGWQIEVRKAGKSRYAATARGPVAAWCRQLMRMYCAACGQPRDSERRDLCTPRGTCSLCGLDSYGHPRPLGLPRLMQ